MACAAEIVFLLRDSKQGLLCLRVDLSCEFPAALRENSAFNQTRTAKTGQKQF